jgi:hypothetical protein
VPPEPLVEIVCHMIRSSRLGVAHSRTRGLLTVRDAIVRCIDVRGPIQWNVVENYEWLRGADVPLGMIDSDHSVWACALVFVREATA